MLYAIVALLVIILDQWTKFWVAGNIALNTGSRELIPGLIKLVNIHNDGAALGFLSGKNAGMFFIILCGVFTIFVIVALATRLIKSSVGRWSLLFIMAGGLSNCIDRILSGYVQDMFMPTFMDKLPIFNVADIFITVFCLVFILFVLFGGKHDEEDYDEDEDELEDEDEEEDELEDEDEEDMPRAHRLPRETKSEKKSFLFGRRDDEDEEDEDEDDEEEDEEPAPRRRGLFGRKLRDEDEDEDEEEDEDDEDEEPAPRRRGLFGRKPRDEEDEDEDEDDEEEDIPARRPRKAAAVKEKKPTRRDRQAELDEKYARFKAERAEREQQWSVPEEEKPSVVDPADPFAEWDAANRKAEGRRAAAPAPAEEKPAAPAPVAEAPAPVKPAKPAAKVELTDDDMNFTLEDILAEFK